MLLVVVGGLAIIVIAFVLITQVFGGSDSSTTSVPATNSIATTSGTTTSPATNSAVDPAATQVAVFNGTTGSGLARAAADKLQAAGLSLIPAGICGRALPQA